MVTKTYGASVQGVDASIVTIETNTSEGGTGFFLVGLPDNAVKESRERVDSSLKELNYFFPRKKVVVNLAPADVKKEGTAYDLPIALTILNASEQTHFPEIDQYVILGELALDGQLRPVKGVLPIAIETQKRGFKGFILPLENAPEAAIVEGLDVYGVENIKQAVDLLSGKLDLKPYKIEKQNPDSIQNIGYKDDFEHVQGQEKIKRAMEIAAAGGHNIIMIGPPGAGKTMLAKRLPSILPPLNLNEALETTKIHSVAGLLMKDGALIANRPFRAPHHTVSDVALVGGGGNPQPGEISLAHNGVLFLDELPEYKRTVLEVLRQPLEDRKINISRARSNVTYPANFMFVASMNPCPCGYYNHPEKECVCPPGTVQKYLNKISGPLLDRIDLHVEVTPVSFDHITSNRKSENSLTIRERVLNARKIQNQRFENLSEDGEVHCNAMMPSQMVKKVCAINDTSKTLLKSAMEKLDLSARAYDRILKVARTIADLDQSEEIQPHHIAEAIQYRSLDRENWAVQ